VKNAVQFSYIAYRLTEQRRAFALN